MLNTAAIINFRRHKCNYRMEDRQIPQADWIKKFVHYDFLDKLGIEYQRIDHEAAFTMEVCEEIDKTLGATICKNLFLCNRQKTDFTCS